MRTIQNREGWAYGLFLVLVVIAMLFGVATAVSADSPDTPAESTVALAVTVASTGFLHDVVRPSKTWWCKAGPNKMIRYKNPPVGHDGWTQRVPYGGGTFATIYVYRTDPKPNAPVTNWVFQEKFDVLNNC